MKVTVSIITRDRSKLLYAVLESLTKQIIKPFEILIIDNSSNDNTEKIYFQFRNKCSIRYIKEDHIGIPYARNRALYEAHGDILAFLDDDMTVSPNWIAKIIVAHKRYESAIAIQGYYFNMPRDDMYSSVLEYFQNNWLKDHMNVTFQRFKELIKTNRDGEYIKTTITRNCSFKLDLLREIDSKFNTEMPRGSDTDFGKTLIDQNQTIIFCPSIESYHWEKNTFLTFISKNFIRGKTRFVLDKKWDDLPIIVKKQIKINLVNLLQILFKKNVSNQIRILHFTFLLYLYRIIFTLGYLFEKYKHMVFLQREMLARKKVPYLFYCPVCRSKIHKFIRFDISRKDRAKCPKCGSRERYRLLTLFLEKETSFFMKGGSVLEIGPSEGFSNLCKKNKKIKYKSIDLIQENAASKMDITDLKFSAETFDFIVCSHVLEHVQKDFQAINEMYRVLKKNGICFIMVPLDKKMQKTIEEEKSSKFNSTKREEIFGQYDHVRIYGRDFVQRLISGGFIVETVPYVKKISIEDKKKYGIADSYKLQLYTTSDDIYVCKK